VAQERRTLAASVGVATHTSVGVATNASVARVFQPSDGITAIFVCGLINRSGGRPWQVLSTLGLSVHALGVLGEPLTHLCLQECESIDASELILVCCFDRLHRVALGDRVTSRWCLLLLEVATS
jgi:hypothetical protein